MIEVHLYGKLRRFAEDPSPNGDSIILVPAREGENIGDIVDRVGIPREELGRNIFLNGNLSALNRAVHDGDRLALFPPDMTLLYRQYFSVHE